MCQYEFNEYRIFLKLTFLKIFIGVCKKNLVIFSICYITYCKIYTQKKPRVKVSKNLTKFDTHQK